MHRIKLMAVLAVAATLAGCSEESSKTASNPTGQPAPQPAGDSAPQPENQTADRTIEQLDGWDGVRNMFSDGEMYFAGQPDQASFGRLADEGVTTVVNIRQASEIATLGFDEQAIVESLGLKYVHISVSPATFSAEDVERFAEAVEAAEGRVLLHCASSNRVGGMWAVYLVMEKGIDLKEAIEQGRAAGMSRDAMVEAVNRVAGGAMGSGG